VLPIWLRLRIEYFDRCIYSAALLRHLRSGTYEEYTAWPFNLHGRTSVSVVPVAQALRISEQSLSLDQDNKSLLNEVCSTGLITSEQGCWQFRHELIEHFLQGEALVQKAKSIQELCAALVQPINHALAEDVVSLQTDPATVRACLEALSNPIVIAKCLVGALGYLAHEIASQDIRTVFTDAACQLKSLDAEYHYSEENFAPGILSVSTNRSWSAYHVALINAVAMVLDKGLYLQEVLS